MFDGKYLEWNQRRIKCIVDFYGHNSLYQKKVLDLGCGQADISGALYRLGADVTAVDARQEHLKIASKKFQGIKVVKADIERGWPFNKEKFDIVLSLGLLCHLRDYRQHLVDICFATNNLVLETAVLDSDEEKSVSIDENKGVYDSAINGVGCRPSAAAIEKVLTECGMHFNRIDSSHLNVNGFVYDWKVKNTNDTNIVKRRLWFCNKVNNPSFEFVNNSPLATNSKSSSLQFVNRQSPIARPPNSRTQNNSPIENYHTLTMHHNMIEPNAGTDEISKQSRMFSISPENNLSRYPNLKVLYVPLGNQTGMIEAWNNIGVQLKVFDFWTAWNNHGQNNQLINKQFLDHVRDFQPNLIHMQLQITNIITEQTLIEAKRMCPGVIISNWSGDIRDHIIQELKSISNAIDFTLISSTGQLEMYKQAGVPNVKYWQIGYDPKAHYPKNYTDFKYDLTFIANNYGGQFPGGQTRISAYNECQRTFGNRLGIFGTGWSHQSGPCNPEEANEIYNKSICALSISNFNDVSHYFSDRLLYCLSSGRPTISWYFPGCESYFEHGKEIFFAKSNNDIIDFVNQCKQDPEKANKVGAAGAQRASLEHTYTSRVLELLYIIGLSKQG